jgi:hypothetical protein
MFPDVLDAVLHLKNLDKEINALPGVVKKRMPGEIKADDSAPPKKASPEDKTSEPVLPVDMKQYFEGLVVVDQTQGRVDAPVPTAGSDLAILSTLIARVKISDSETQVIDSGGVTPLKDFNSDTEIIESDNVKITIPERQKNEGGESPEVVPETPATAKILSDGVAVEHANLPHVEMQVTKVETAFAPMGSALLAVQVSKAIADGLEGSGKSPAVVPVNMRPDPRPDIVRSIELQLHPDDLGKIKVQMRLRGNDLNLKIEVVNRQVETLLLKDHQALKELMGHAGYNVTDASISISVSPVDLNILPRNSATADLAQESFLGQGNRSYQGASGENKNQFQNMRGFYAPEPDSDGRAKISEVGSGNTGRGSGIFI